MARAELSAKRTDTPPSGESKFLITALFGGFVVTGAATVLLAPLLPLLSAKWNLTDQTAGLLFTCQFLGSMFGTLLSGYLIRRIGFGGTLFSGYLLMGVYVLAVWHAPWPWLAMFAALNGIGLGLVIPATNMAVSDSFPRNRAAALNLINLSWSVGAIACPAMMAAARKTGHLGGTLLVLSTLTVAIGLAVARAKIAHIANEERTTSAALPRLPFVVLAALFFLYIGSEGAVANWLATYAKRTVLSSGVLWMTAPSFFWAAMMLGRAVAPSILRKVNEPTVVVGGLLVSALGVLAILLGRTPVVVLCGAAAAGLGMCSVFPIFIAMVSHIFRDAATKVSSYMFAMAGLGGAVLPWLVGVVSSHTGRLQVGLFVALGGIVAQIVLFRFLPGSKTQRAD